jgi:DNA polymerase IV
MGVASHAKSAGRRRSILHLDLQPFFVSVERALDPSLRGRPVVIGGRPDGSGVVAAASHEARAAGVKEGQPLAAARRACPEAAFLPGDLEAYARASQDVTTLLLSSSRRIERPSADEAYLDLTRESDSGPHPVQAAEAIKDDLQRRLGLEVSLGLASSRLAARVASSWARPRGLLVVLPGYEAAFLARQPISFLGLPPHLERALEAAGLHTLGAVAGAPDEILSPLVGHDVARLKQSARGEVEEPIAVAAPPTFIREEAVVRDRRSDAAILAGLVERLAEQACRRLRPFGLGAGMLAVEVERGESSARREEAFEPPLRDEATARAVARALAEPLLEPAKVRLVRVRLSRLAPLTAQRSLLPPGPASLRNTGTLEFGA